MFRIMKCFEMVALFVGILLPLATSQAEERIYKSRSHLDVAWTASVPEKGVLPLSKLYAFEDAVSAYINGQLQTEEETGLLSGKRLLLTTANVKDQQVEFETGLVESKQAIIVINLSLLVVYAGDEKITGLDSILTELFADHQRKEELFSILKDANIVDSDTTMASMSTSFSALDNVQEMDPLFALKSESDSSRSGADKALIIACTFLSIALIFVSFVLLWVVADTENQKCFFFFRKRVGNTFPHGVTHKYGSKDQDEDHVTSASGIIGANPNYDPENVPPAGAGGAKMTPHRGVYREEIMSPLSQITSTTNYTDTDASRPPLGIRSIRKLARYATPEKRKSTNPYQMSKLTYT